MKKVAGKLRLDLAAYYELQDFARLGTELDRASQRRLERGHRMVELLKQPQFAPLSVREQVIAILAGSSGLLDDVSVTSVSGFTTEMIRWLNERHPDLVDEINKTGKLTDELSSRISEGIKEFKSTYNGK